jgi:hypothetical protein
MNKTYLGIDIGISGAIAVIDDKNIFTYKMPLVAKQLDTNELYKIIASFKTTHKNLHICFEKLGLIFGSSKKTAFSMGYQMGVIEALCVGQKISYTAVRAVDWQKEMFKHTTVITKPGKTSRDTKAMALVTIKKLFPDLTLTFNKEVKPNDGLVDAVLIAEYAKRNNL